MTRLVLIALFYLFAQQADDDALVLAHSLGANCQYSQYVISCRLNFI